MMKALCCLLCLCVSSALAGESAAPVEISRAEFGIIDHGQLTVTQQVPLTVGLAYGWQIQLKNPKASVKWREVFILPNAPKTWKLDGFQGKSKISDDKQISVLERVEQPVNGMISNVWSVAKGDPQGRYVLRVTIDDTLERVFVFDVLPTTKKSN